ncbi:hypothetical protein GCM10025776_24240 [Corallincola platygyrae]
MPGGKPFGVLLGDYAVSAYRARGERTNDAAILREIANTAAASFAPFICSASPELFEVDQFRELPSVSEPCAHFAQPEYSEWQSLRRDENSKFLGLVLPRILMRQPYRSDSSRNEAFAFEERIANKDQDLVWGNANFAFGSVLIRAFCESGWFSQIRGIEVEKVSSGLVTGVPNFRLAELTGNGLGHHSTDVQISDRLEKQLADTGVIPLVPVNYSALLAFYSNPSLQAITVNEDNETKSQMLASMLQYTLCVCRFAHYLKVMGRDIIGSHDTAASIETTLQAWLHQYTTSSDNSSNELRAKYPLGAATIKVKERAGKPGHYFSVIHLRPHFQLDQMVSSIKLVTELTPAQGMTV